MPRSQSTQLETILDEAIQSSNIQALHGFLQRDFGKGITFQCSQYFLNKLETFIDRNLDHSNFPALCLAFTVIYKCGKNLNIAGDKGLPALIKLGLVKKMLQWFEKCRQLWLLGGTSRDENLLNLAEDFFDALKEIHESGNTGLVQVTESFLYPVGNMAVDTQIYILIQKEAIRKFNMILDKSPVDLKKDRTILRSQEATDIMAKIVSRIMDGGDYDFQTALMEALCRMAPREQRKQLAERWFSMEHVLSAFIKIKDSEFETDCRKFLNLVNGMKGDRTSVFSFPCLEVYLGQTELLMPMDENMDEFWIDFNIGSQSISFYFSLPEEDSQEAQWETICIHENEVKSYTIKEEGKRKVLQLDLSEVVICGSAEGSALSIHFSWSLEILHVVQKIYGYNKNMGFVGKTGRSEVKTTVKVMLDENNATSQTVPESQLSLGENDKNITLIQKTPARMRLSESTTYINSSGGGGAKSVSTVLPSGKGRPSLEMACLVERSRPNEMVESRSTVKNSIQLTPITARKDSATEKSSTLKTTDADKNRKRASLSKASAQVLPGPGEDEPPLDSTFVPDSQPTTGRNISSNWHKFSVSEMLMMPTQKVCSLPISGGTGVKQGSPPSSAQKQMCLSSAQRTSAPSSGPIHPKQLHAELTQRLQKVLVERNKALSPQVAPVPRKEVCNKKSDPQPKSTVAPTDTVASDEKEKKKPQRHSKPKGKNKIQPQNVVEEDTDVVKVPVKAVEENMPLAVKSTALSSKEKRDAEVTGKLVKHISSHYEVNSLIKVKGKKISHNLIPPLIDRSFFNLKWHTSMGKVTTMVKSNSNTKTVSTHKSKDVYAFNVDTPQSIGLNKTITSSTCISATDEDSRLPSTKKKQPPPPKAKRQVKKHLFSDSDTERVTTDQSWLKESNRKPKPKVIQYSRQAPAKPNAAPALPSCDSPDLPLPVPLKAITKSSKNVSKRQQKTEKAAPAQTKASVASRRPTRATANTRKNYKEVESDESQSEPEPSKVKESRKSQEIQERNMTNKKSKSYGDPENDNSQSESEEDQPHFSEPKLYECESRKQETKSTSRPDAVITKKQEKKSDTALQRCCEKQLKPVNVLKASAEKNKKPSKKNAAPVKEQTATLKQSWDQIQASVSPPPSFIERMRSAERSGPSLDMPCSPVLSLQASPLTLSPPFVPDTLTPVMVLPKQRTRATSAEDPKTPTFYNADKKQSASRTNSIKSVTTIPSVSPIGLSKQCAAMRTSDVKSLQDLTSPPQSPLCLSQPLMTSTLVNQDKPLASGPQSPFLEVHSSRSSHHSTRSSRNSTRNSRYSTRSSLHSTRSPQHSSCNKISPVSEASVIRVSSNSSPSVTAKDKAIDALIFGPRAEKTPKMEEKIESDEDVVSGPSRKRHMSYSSSNSDDEDKQKIKKCRMRTQHSPRMKPRKLFKSASKEQDPAESWQDQKNTSNSRSERKTKVTQKKSVEEQVSMKKKRCKTYINEDTVTEVSAEGGVSQLLSSTRTVISGQWDADVEDMEEDMDGSGLNPRDMCRELSCKLKQKFKSQFKMVEVYNKQSLKSVQQHISTISSEVAKHRTHDLEQVQRVLLEEVHKLEQDDIVLKNMENDITMQWNKQIVTFRSLQKQDKRRNKVLRKTLENNLCRSLEHEERVFTSQMCLIRKDMKSAQDRLLTDMHDGEIQSIKRGLHTLFFPDAARF